MRAAKMEGKAAREGKHREKLKTKSPKTDEAKATTRAT
jgi:hypothetical protein